MRVLDRKDFSYMYGYTGCEVYYKGHRIYSSMKLGRGRRCRSNLQLSKYCAELEIQRILSEPTPEYYANMINRIEEDINEKKI